MAFSHPRTVRTGEPYDASVTLLNTGITPANLVQVTLNKNSISGARLEDEGQQTVELGTILPGQSVTATFRMRSLRTGAVSFSNLTTSDDSVVGRFRLSMGVDERGWRCRRTPSPCPTRSMDCHLNCWPRPTGSSDRP